MPGPDNRSDNPHISLVDRSPNTHMEPTQASLNKGKAFLSRLSFGEGGVSKAPRA